MTLAQRFYNLKTRIAGNEQKYGYEHTFRQPVCEKYNITAMTKANRRIIGELEFALHLSAQNQDKFDGIIENALEFLEKEAEKSGALSDGVCAEAENILLPLKDASKEYTALLIAHAHIDMNWQWGYDETVAITLATFRTMLNIMNEYPDFHFSQSQASVYKIVEEHDPEMMEEIKARIAEGRWEVTATAWVETDKNMPSAESLIRHIEQSKNYLSKVWGVKNFDIDFSPDTFGHSKNVPEINGYGGVKYYYHCRGIRTDLMLYRFAAPSGKEVLVCREPNWYNGGITENIGATLIRMSQCSAGIKTLPVLYGVGDHGGGPTRRDIERAYEMMEWPVYPVLRFGTLVEFFKEAEKLRDTLPVIDRELNFVFPGCYTTQSRIKRGNRRMESALYSAESIGALASGLTDFKWDEKSIDGAWQNVLFNHFHDIITGSCVAESRDYAMALYQRTAAVTNTAVQNATRMIGLAVDTSGIETDCDSYSTSEGAGVGYGVKNFIGVPSTERGIGKTRIYHLFNPLPYPRTETAELTLWDWVGDITRIAVFDKDGNELESQLIDSEQRAYWDHRYLRVLCRTDVPALGYTTVVVKERELARYPVYSNEKDPRESDAYDGIVLENGYLRALIDPSSGRLVSIFDKEKNSELVSGIGAGFTYIETEHTSSDAWKIGRYVKKIPVDRCLELKTVCDGALSNRVRAVYKVCGSTVKAEYSLDSTSRAVRVDADIDWLEQGNGSDTVPVLVYDVPLKTETEQFVYGVPAGYAKRSAAANDVPGNKYALAGRLLLMSDCKYGYRGEKNMLTLTLINSAVKPDPYPELGKHKLNIYVGACDISMAERVSQMTDTAIICQPSNSHGGSLPLECSLLTADGDNVTVSAVIVQKNGVLVRFYETEGRKERVTLTFSTKIKSAEAVDLAGNKTGQTEVCGNNVTVISRPYSITAIEVEYEK